MTEFVPHGNPVGISALVRQAGETYKLRSLADDAWTGLMPTTARCLFCPDTFEGTAEQAVLWGRNHREMAHPGLRRLTRAERKKLTQAGKQAHMARGPFLHEATL